MHEDGAQPYSQLTDTELYLLSSMVFAESAADLDAVCACVTEQDFFNPLYGTIFAVIREQHLAGHATDLGSIRAEMLRRGDAMPEDVVNQLALALASVDARGRWIRSYARDVLSYSYRRQFKQAVERLDHAAETAAEDQLFELLVEEGTRQRRAWERYRSIDLDSDPK